MNNTIKIIYKTAFGLLGLSAVITEIVALVGLGVFNPSNFFSYFTILSNIFAFSMLLIGAYYLLKHKQSKRVDMLRGAAALYMIITGIVFATLLANIEGITLTAVPWDNTVLHYIIPVVMLIDWLIDRPSASIGYKKSLIWLAFPIVYLAYSLIRGPIVGWYPYPFLNPANNGYEGVVMTGIGIAVVSLVLSLLLVKLSRLHFLNNI